MKDEKTIRLPLCASTEYFPSNDEVMVGSFFSLGRDIRALVRVEHVVLGRLSAAFEFQGCLRSISWLRSFFPVCSNFLVFRSCSLFFWFYGSEQMSNSSGMGKPQRKNVCMRVCEQ